MQDRHLCCPPTFLLGHAVPPHFFHSRIATDRGLMQYIVIMAVGLIQ